MTNPFSRRWMIIAIVASTLIMAFILVRLIGLLQLYHIPTTASEPTIKKGSLVWASSLKKPDRHSFIVYRGYDSVEGRSLIYVYRCMGLPGDAVQMKNGVTFVNGINADIGFETKKSYALYSPDISTILGSTGIHAEDEPIDELEQMTYLFLSPNETKLLSAACKPGRDSLVVVDMSQVSPNFMPFLYRLGKGAWRLENFGPFKVPIGHFFVLGDNRHNAADSRFTGFVSQDSIVGVLLGK